MSTRPPSSASPDAYFSVGLTQTDPEVAAAVAGELHRQADQIELIASENLVSRAVLEAQGSVLTNKTVEGYPGKRYYGGAEFADTVESLAIERAKQLFNCDYANVQPHSGSNANQAVYLACLQPGDTILSMDIAAGGHISHGHPATSTGRYYRVVSYGLHEHNEQINYQQAEALAQQHRPKLIIAGGSAYPREIDFARLHAIADSCGALLMADIAHVAGLVATGLYSSPFPHAQVVTTTTYKSLRGARGGIVLCNDAGLAKKINTGVFPGVQGSVMLHAVAAKAVCLGEALQPSFKDYCEAVLNNARQLAQSLSNAGVRLVSGDTDCGLLLVDLRQKNLTGSIAVDALEHAGLTCNKNLIPFDPQPPEVASGLRLSSNAGSARGFGTAEFEQIGRWIGQVLDAIGSDGDHIQQQTVRAQVSSLCARFPIYPAIETV